jgi:hypothetical protein
MKSPHDTAEMDLRPPRRGRGPHRLTVLAPTVADIVASAGGWLFDRASAGWSVSVLLADESSDRPLRILGAETVGLCTARACAQQVQYRRFVVISTELLSAGHPLRTALVSGLGERKRAITLWGEPCPGEPEYSIETLTYRPSAAAQAFKAQALVAAGVSRTRAASPEVFRRSSAHPAAAPAVAPGAPQIV